MHFHVTKAVSNLDNFVLHYQSRNEQFGIKNWPGMQGMIKWGPDYIEYWFFY